MRRSRSSISRLRAYLSASLLTRVFPPVQLLRFLSVRSWEAGINTFDTADVYSNGLSEIILGNAIKKLNIPREEIVVLSKVFFTVAKKPEEYCLFGEGADNTGYVNQWGLSRKHIFDGVKNSLKRLQLDYIDVLQCHRFDYDTPIEETMQALHDVVKAGYVRYIGMSSCHAHQFQAMQSTSGSCTIPLVVASNGSSDRLCNQQQPHAVHFNAEPLQLALSRRGEGDVPRSEGIILVCFQVYFSPHICLFVLGLRRWSYPVVSSRSWTAYPPFERRNAPLRHGPVRSSLLASYSLFRT
ncbi:hypothetical protein CC2G_008200 [Coprinopsis cinerea AmutBmut pab1-1]|nr:hypothetical protein CC2G_008200 [Coprinopsis cinerea AmutBmut pab1-1]